MPGARWEYGANLDYVRGLCEYWRDEYDWRAEERRLVPRRGMDTTAPLAGGDARHRPVDRDVGGGHFDAFEQPALLVEDLTKLFRTYRWRSSTRTA